LWATELDKKKKNSLSIIPRSEILWVRRTGGREGITDSS